MVSNVTMHYDPIIYHSVDAIHNRSAKRVSKDERSFASRNESCAVVRKGEDSKY